MAELLAVFLAGLSLFFHGVGGIRDSLQGLTSRRLRQQLARLSQHPVLASLWGILSGAITQSSTAVAFIVAGLVSGGLISVPRALPIVAWANLGTVVLVLFASFDTHLAILYLLGVSGLGLAFNLGAARTRLVLTVLFCASLLFFGLDLMKDAFKPLPTFPWFKDVTAFVQGSTFATFVLGALLRIVLQSSAGISVIAIALAHGGVLSVPQAATMMYGTGVGVGLAVVLLASNLQGPPRQIALFQAFANTASALLLAGLFYVEQSTGTPLALQLTQQLAVENLQLGLVYLLLQLATAAIAVAAAPFAERPLRRLAPLTEEQDLARPRFISGHALADAESALDLAAKEQLHLLGHLPAQLDTIRSETAATARVPAETLQRATEAVSAEVRAFLHEIADLRSDHNTSARLLALERRQTLVGSLNETVFSFVTATASLRPQAPAIEPFLDSLAESLHALVLTAIDTVRSGDSSDRDLLLRMTADRGETLERLRRNVTSGSHALDHAQKAQLFYLTSVFERAVWLLRQLAQTS